MFHGWKVVCVAFLVAVFAWGLGFYGVGVFVSTLRDLHGWTAAAVSGAVTVYYLLGGTLIMFVSIAFERLGPRRVVLTGVAAMAMGAIGLTFADAVWHLYLTFPLMAIGWACTSGAAINLILAPWFERKRGRAVSLAFNGASFGGILVAPLLLFTISHLGYRNGVVVVCAGMVVVLIPLIVYVVHRGPEVLGLGPDGGPAIAASTASVHRPTGRWVYVRSLHFWTISAPFALALMAQVGFITHQVSYLKPIVGVAAAGWAVSATTLGAVVGRLVVAAFVDRANRRTVAAGNFLMQACGVGLLLIAHGPVALYAGCVLFGLGVGNTTSLPSLIVQAELPKAAFGTAIGAVIAINQFTYALGPSLLGGLRDWQGSYELSLGACVLLFGMAGLLVLLRPGLFGSRPVLRPQEEL